MKPAVEPISLEEANGEITLWRGDVQMMQAWETELMHISADLVCDFGETFLEVGLGIGLSGLRIASNPRTRSHTIVEKYARVIELWREKHPVVPPTLSIVNADIFDYIRDVPSESFDAIYFDPELPPEINDSLEIMGPLVLEMKRTLCPGGALVSFFSHTPCAKEKYMQHFSRVLLVKHPFETYDNTNYMDGVRRGDAYIPCFLKE